MALVEADTCSGSSLGANEPLAGTAPHAVGWIAIEQVGPFGHDALRQSHFPLDVAEQLLNKIGSHPIRPALIRRVGKHADAHSPMPVRQVYLASSLPGAARMVTAQIRDPAELLSIDFGALATGDVATAWPRAEFTQDPILLVCTHAKRDVCCALKGRPVAHALSLDPRHEGLVWETSHLGGHRFAATAVQLPHGWVHGRLDTASAAAVLDDACATPRTVSMASARGLSSLSGPAQAADIAARVQLGVNEIDGTSVEQLSDDRFLVTSGTGRNVQVRVELVDLESQRRESCTKAVMPGRVFKTSIL